MDFNCWQLDTCKDMNCNSCVWYKHIMYLCKQSMIPENRLFTPKLKTLDTNDYSEYVNVKSNIVDFVNSGRNLDIRVKAGINEPIEYGIKLMLNYFSQISYTCEYGTYGLFINVPSYIDKLKDNITLCDENIINLKQSIDEVPLVVFNNMLVNSEFEKTIMLRHCSNRIDNKLSTIFVRTSGNANSNGIVDLFNNIQIITL